MRSESSVQSSKRLFRSSLAAAAMSLIAMAGCASQPDSSATSASSNPVIVRLVSQREVITITAGPGAPLYTVADPSGRVLVSGMTMHDLKMTQPELYQRLAPALAPSAQAWAGE